MGARGIENNLDSPPGTIDLHGLYVKEGESAPTSGAGNDHDEAHGRCTTTAVVLAIERVDAALDQAKRNDEDELRIIVGTSPDRRSVPTMPEPHPLTVTVLETFPDDALSLSSRTGKGIHSQGHVAKIKPAVEEMMKKYNLSAHVDPTNTGVLVVDLRGREGMGRSRDAGRVVDELGGKGQECVIM